MWLCFLLQIFHTKQKWAETKGSDSSFRDAGDEGSDPFVSPHSLLRCSPKLVLKLRYDSFDLPFGAVSRVSILILEQRNELGPSAVDAIDFVGTELSPMVFDFTTKLLPLCLKNIKFHASPLTDMFLRSDFVQCIHER